MATVVRNGLGRTAGRVTWPYNVIVIVIVIVTVIVIVIVIAAGRVDGARGLYNIM